jgi:hypothetical protein
VDTFLDELMLPWREDLAQIVERGVQQGVFRPPDAIGDFTTASAPCSTGSESSTYGTSPACPATAWPNSPWTPPAPS